MLRRLYLAGGFALLAVVALAASWWLLHLRSQSLNDALDTLRRTEIATLQLRRRENAVHPVSPYAFQACVAAPTIGG